MRESCDILIIGGGVVGCSVAFHLTQFGRTDVLVVERDFLASGATGRCGGGIRAQWSTEGNIKLAQHSIKEFENFKEITGAEIQFRQGGYLLPAYTQEMVEQFKQNVSLQNKHGVPSRLISPEEVAEIVPLMNRSEILAATFCPTDGVANPFLVTDGYANAARRKGARFLLRRSVVGFRTSGSRVQTAILDDGTEIDCSLVLNAAGAWAGEVTKLLGTEIPVTPYRHQILVTEPLEIIHRPMVIDLYHNIYFSQSEEGGFITGQTDEDEKPSFNMMNSWRFVVEISRKLLYHYPCLRKVNVLRQWAGLYAVTPDAQPILGRVNEYENFFCATGWSGHGFMISPAVGKIMAELFVFGRPKTLSIEEYSIERFKKGEFIREKSVV
ncbi:MAG: FAD-binding oxidoreductase [Planctomycetota bacterium]|nr:FAD-binding oxidoreductase [Planctomycetota bacterium]